ncbi:TNFAIP3-interacting protein 1 isoform 2-T2 [Discoglossus pictus]
MENKGPYRIYDPGGITCKVLVKESQDPKENMEGIMSLGDLLEESQNEVIKLRQKVEALVKDNQLLQCSAPLDPESSSSGQEVPPRQLEAGQDHQQGSRDAQIANMHEEESGFTPKSNQKTPPSGASSEFEILNGPEKRKTLESRKSDPGPTLQHEQDTMQHHLQRLESSLSMCAEEPVRDRLLTHLSRMALDFNRLASKVNKNELRTSVLQTLCEQLRKENEDLREKLEADWKQRSQNEQALRYENVELRKMIMQLDRGTGKGTPIRGGSDSPAVEDSVKVENAGHQQAAKLQEKPSSKDPTVALMKKVKVLEHQRTELLEVNKQWDQQFRSMKLQYEEKITSLRQKISHAMKSESEHEVEKDRKQRDFDRKLLLARDKIEEKESQIQKLETELKELKQKNKFLYEQLGSISKHRDYQEREISRLNKALEEALNMQGSGPRSPSFNVSTENTERPPRQELMTQNDILKQQVTIFEEDFQRERSDRERMNEEKEELKVKLEQLQAQLGQVNTQLRTCQEDLRREKENAREAVRPQERYVDPHQGPLCPPYQYPYSPPGLMYPGFEEWQILYPPPVVPPEHSQVQEVPNIPPPAYQWRLPSVIPRTQNPKGAEVQRVKKKEADVAGGGAPIQQKPT